MIHSDTQELSANPVQRAVIPAVEPVPAVDALTLKMEAFCTAYLDNGGDANAAWRASYDASGMSAGSVRVAAHRLMRTPKVAARLRTLKDAIAERTLVSVAGRLMHQIEIVEADPNEVYSVRVYNCRRCATGRYQYRDAAELAQALDAFLRSQGTPKPLPLPADASPPDFGFDPWGEPVATCVHCLGHGIPHPVIHDTTKLSAAGRKLYKGFEVKPDGTIKVLTHDQQAASDMIHKMLGAYVVKTESKSFNVNYNLTAPTSPQAPISAEDAIAKLRAIGVLAPDDDASVVSDQ
ncbi:MAG: terminase small subunit [Steroidobacteraceae bacterium]